MKTTTENIVKVIRGAGNSDYVDGWQQLDDWKQANKIIDKPIEKWSDYEDMVVYGLFLEILAVMGIKDTGFESYDQMIAEARVGTG